MDEPPIGFSEEGARRIAETVRRVEAMSGSSPPRRPASINTQSPEVHPVRVTASTPIDGHYPGILLAYDAQEAEYAHIDGSTACWVIAPNGEPLSEQRYYCRRHGDWADEDGDTRPVFAVCGGAGLEPDIVLIRNETIDDLERFAVVGLGPVLTLPEDDLEGFQASIGFEGYIPSSTTRAGRFAVLVEDIAVGEIGRAIVSGVTQVLVSVNPNCIYQCAEKKNNTTEVLQNQSTGTARILWIEDNDEDEQWAIVRLGDSGCSGTIHCTTTTSTTTTSTTTTEDPGCSGTCRFRWEYPDWAMTVNSCTGGCRCETPQYCGTDDECEVTTTSCVRFPSAPPCCATTTTTTPDPGTTTTTTTTTLDPTQCTGCVYKHIPYIGWRAVEDNCNGLYCGPCEVDLPADPEACSEAAFPCQPLPPDPPPPPCLGECLWVYVDLGDGGSWVYVDNVPGYDCTPGINGCHCQQPTYGGSDCALTTSPCKVVPNTTTTPGPGTTTTSTTTTCDPTNTTTTPDPEAPGCYWSCTWRCGGGTWGLDNAVGCPSPECGCAEPPFDCTGCETFQTPCGATTTTTTTTEEPTTTTTSTTTAEPDCSTTTPEPGQCGLCTWYPFDCNSWTLNQGCTGGGSGCECVYPECTPLEVFGGSGPPCVLDEQAQTIDSYCTGTTTEEPTTTSTTTTTTEEPTTTTTDEPTTTTTTEEPAGECEWLCNSGGWDLIAGCPFGYGCDVPPQPCSPNGSTAYTPCV